jgi:hypothetical protein
VAGAKRATSTGRSATVFVAGFTTQTAGVPSDAVSAESAISIPPGVPKFDLSVHRGAKPHVFWQVEPLR